MVPAHLVERQTARVTAPAEHRTRTSRLCDYRELGHVRVEIPRPRRNQDKSNGPDGQPCLPWTAGLLSRRCVLVQDIALIGKDANRLAEREKGLFSLDDTHTLKRRTRGRVPCLRTRGLLSSVAARRISQIPGRPHYGWLGSAR